MMRIAILGFGSVGRGIARALLAKDLDITVTGLADSKSGIIDAGGIDAPVLAWVADPYKLYSMQIQGSGKIQLKDGGLIRLAYAEQNGYPFMPNATRGDQDNMLLAIKARALMEPPTVDVPGATRGAKKSGGSSASDDEVARIVAALSSGGSTTASISP